MANFNDTTPVAPLPDVPFYLNGVFQVDGSDISVYWPKRQDLLYTGTLCGAGSPGPTSDFVPYQSDGESLQDFAMPTEGFVRNLSSILSTTPTTHGYLTQRLVKQSLGTDLSVAFPMGTPVGTVNIDTHNAIPISPSEPVYFTQNTEVGSSGGAGCLAFEWVALDGSGLLAAVVNGSSAGVSDRFIHLGQEKVADTENLVEIKIPFACTVDRLQMVATGVQTSGTTTITLRKNGADTPVAVTLPTGANIGNNSDMANTATYAAGDTACLHWVNTGTSTVYISNISFRVTPVSGHRSIVIGRGPVLAQSHDFVIRLFADTASAAGNSANYLFPCPMSGTFRNFYAMGSMAGTFRYTLYKNSAPTALTVLLTGVSSTITWGSDLTHSVSAEPGDTFYVLVERTSGQVGIGSIVFEFESA